MSGAGSPTCRPESVHPRRPRGSQSGWEKRGARTWNGFRRAFSPDPTDRPWVSEDGISTIIKTCRKIWSGKLILAAMRWKSKQKNKTKNIYLNKLPNISVWKQTFFRGLKKPCFTGGAGVNSSVSYSPPFKSPYPSGLALHSFYFCRLSTNVPKLRKSTVLVMKFFSEKCFQRLGYWVSPLTVQNRLDRRQSV